MRHYGSFGLKKKQSKSSPCFITPIIHFYCRYNKHEMCRVTWSSRVTNKVYYCLCSCHRKEVKK